MNVNLGNFRELETQLTVMLMNKEDEDLVISITNDDVKVSYERIRDGSITTLTQVISVVSDF